ncbi:hypothetical protein MSPP1_002101 [Malassezia sp. CBS 17886]|nr:hypothetical protein MSPP1_002101 [Malassezia sp. CBS 17886]
MAAPVQRYVVGANGIGVAGTSGTRPSPADMRAEPPVEREPQRWRALTEAAFLEPGPTNRLYLSLRSGIPSQVDWALARLSEHTKALGDRFLLAHYPGIDGALFDFLDRLVSALEGRPRADWDPDADAGPTTASGYFVDQGIGAPGDEGQMSLGLVRVPRPRQKPLPAPATFRPDTCQRDADLLRRALQSALVLRNAALGHGNAALLAKVPDVHEVILALLRASMSSAARDAYEAHCGIPADAPPASAALQTLPCADLPVNVLEILEAVAPGMLLTAWVREQFGACASGAPVALPKCTQDALFLWLHTVLHTTHDRALLLGALRCIAALVTNQDNAALFVEADAKLHATRSQMIPRCVALLPLTNDPELLEAAVELLYQLASIGDNALLLGALAPAQVCGVTGAAADGAAVLRDAVDSGASLPHTVVGYLTRNLSMGKSVWERDSPLAVNHGAWWNAEVPSALRLRRRRERERREQREKMSPQEAAQARMLRPDERASLQHLSEPDRSMAWMRLLFEADPAAEVTQMEFWIAYRDQFSAAVPSADAPLQPAATLIRNVSQVFPGAAAMVIPAAPGTQPRFIIRGIAPRDRDVAEDGECRWMHCVYTVPDATQDRHRHLLRHALTHVPPDSGTPADASPAALAPAPPGTVDNPGTITFDVERTPSVPNTVPGEPPLPYGTAFVSLLILRFLTRTAAGVLERAGFGCAAHTYGGAIDRPARHADGDELFGCPVPMTSEDTMPGTVGDMGAGAVPDERHIHAAQTVMDAMGDAEDELTHYAFTNDILCRLVNDTLVGIRPRIGE